MLTCTGLLQGLPVVPRHPRCRILGQLGGVFLQLGEVVEGIGVVQFASMNEAHVEVAHLGAVLGLIEQTILAMQNGLLQGPLTNVVVERGARFAQEQRERFPVLQ